jgi:hypothetical protein
VFDEMIAVLPGKKKKELNERYKTISTEPSKIKLIDRKHKVVYHNTMLENTFQHIRGIGPDTEQKLWDKGILSWDCVLNDEKTLGSLQGTMRHRLMREVEISRQNLLNKNIRYITGIVRFFRIYLNNRGPFPLGNTRYH